MLPPVPGSPISRAIHAAIRSAPLAPHRWSDVGRGVHARDIRASAGRRPGRTSNLGGEPGFARSRDGGHQPERVGAAERGAPVYLRSDNGPEFIAWALRDYCRMTLMATNYIEPGSPWENPFVESFNGRLRDELLNIEEFGSITEAKVLIEDWRYEYNTYRPHSALGGTHTKQVRHNHNQQHPKQPRTRITPEPPTGTPSSATRRARRHHALR
jgi:transposase InsO family protein